MKKKTILRTLAAASAVALLLGGIYLLTKDDVRQKLKETEIKPYMPTPTVLSALDEASAETERNGNKAIYAYSDSFVST